MELGTRPGFNTGKQRARRRHVRLHARGAPKPVSLLREIAAKLEHELVHGYTIMHKEPLLHAVCTALGLEEHIHHNVVGIDKSKVKRQIRELKVERNGAL